MEPEFILNFWLDEVGPNCWYSSDDSLDGLIEQNFKETFEYILSGGNSLWLTYPSGALAYIIVLDQFSKNIFRGSKKSFAADRIALAASKQSIKYEFDLKVNEPARQFFYLPLMHSENLYDQEKCIRQILQKLPLSGHNLLKHARAHRELIRSYGRFPNRNSQLGRANTHFEQEYFEHGGYQAVLSRVNNYAA
tara:strand:+ start:494 stop:1072 length:579 start_codon:yes stop_codon:yes gene_type:complete